LTFKKTSQSKLSPNRPKFAQSGHPGQSKILIFLKIPVPAFQEMFVDYKVMKQAGALDSILSVTTI
jgi:spore maturation protein SpmB